MRTAEGDTGVDIRVPAAAAHAITGPAQNAFARLFLKASVSPTTAAHNDYADVLTFIATAVY